VTREAAHIDAGLGDHFLGAPTANANGVDPAATPELRFSGPVSPEGLLDGRRFLLARESDLRAALDAAESDPGADGAVARVAGAVRLEEGGTRLVLLPAAPLAQGESWGLVLSSRVRAEDGRAVLDEEGKLRPTIARFATAAPPPPDVRLTEVLADAATPEAGGEYVEVLNLGPGPLDLQGWRLEKRSATGSWSGCTAGAGWDGPVVTGDVALLVGGGWDGRYGLPPAIGRFPCGAASLAGGIANDRPPVLRLLDRSGAIAAILDATGIPACAGALEADLAPSEPDGAPGCCSCTEGSPGLAPGSTP